MHRKKEPWLVDWEKVTLRSLASYISGIPRDSKSVSDTFQKGLIILKVTQPEAHVSYDRRSPKWDTAQEI